MTPSTKRSLLKIGFISLISICFFTHASAQFQQIIVGSGIAPMHKSSQTDFTTLSMPYDVFAMYQRGNLGLRVDYTWKGAYQKENFSFTYAAYELSLTYGFKQQFKLENINPYIRLGASKWKTVFTTEGYPGITDYELKVEHDNGYGLIAALGADYIYNNISLGIEGQYAMNGNAQFVAGGFEPQPLSAGNFRLMLMAKYSLPIQISSPRGFAITCPKF